MAFISKIDVKNQDLLASMQEFLKSILLSEQVDALLVPCHHPEKNSIMPTLISDPDKLERANPLAPSFPLNCAKIASRLTRGISGETIALVMRPCEIRAFTELIKLKQGSLSDIIILGTDCLGTYDNHTYSSYEKEDPFTLTRQFISRITDNPKPDEKDSHLSTACSICEHPVPVNADIIIGLYGIDYQNEILLDAQTSKGEELLKDLNLSGFDPPEQRRITIDTLIADRTEKRNRMFDRVSQETGSLKKLSTYLTGCINCYNCRVACPVCYCRECVFVTDVFDHQPYQYMQWAKRKGQIKLPSDTMFYHLTRMAHIGLTCVGCGQCSQACPHDIPLVELFRTVAHTAQKAFSYEAGRSLNESLPLSVFEEDEYEGVVGITSKL